MANDTPQHFDRAFLRWFRERTEETWRKYPLRTPESFVTSRARKRLAAGNMLAQRIE